MMILRMQAPRSVAAATAAFASVLRSTGQLSGCPRHFAAASGGSSPAGTLHLNGQGLPLLACSESGLPGWSSPLVNAATQEFFDASAVDWVNGVWLAEERLGWRFALPARQVRVLVAGRGEGLPGLVEVRQVPRGQPVYFLYRREDWEALAGWAEAECTRFEQLPVRDGIPPGWRLAACLEVRGDRQVRSAFPELALSERARLALVGGVRSGPGLSFFPFAPPSLLLEGGDGRESVLCNGQTLAAGDVARSFEIPYGLPVETRITLEVKRGGEPLKSRSIYLRGQSEWRLTTPQQVVDRLGHPAEDPKTGVAGALPIGLPSTEGFSPSLMLTPGVKPGAARVLFIGRVPGEIYSWPSESGPPGWSPVWAVPMGRRGQAVYCGTSVETDIPAPDERKGDCDRVKFWRLVMWHRRKRIREPEEPELAVLWRSYVEAARHV